MLQERRDLVATSYLGVGLYSIPEAGRIVGAPISRVRRWLDPESGVVERCLNPAERTITFVELMDLFFIRMFRDEGVSLQTIRKVSEAAAKKFRAAHPFAVKRFDTDGKTVFATLKSDPDEQELVEDLAKSQYVFDNILRPFFRKLEYDRYAIRYWPLERDGRVVLDPERHFGKPIDAESGIPTKTIHEAVTAGGGQECAAVAQWLGISIDAVNAAVEFERSLSS